MSFYAVQAAQFSQMGKDLQSRLTNDGAQMDTKTYTSLEKQRDALLNKATLMNTADVQATLAQMKGVDQPHLQKTTAELNVAVRALQKFDRLAAVAASAITLATAIASANPGAIASGIVGAEKALADAAAPAKPQAMAMAKSQNLSAEPIAIAAAAAPASRVGAARSTGKAVKSAAKPKARRPS